jgi:voltage-gated potassium channel
VSARRRIHELLEPGHRDDTASRAVDTVILGLIAVNVLAVIAESMVGVRARYGGVLSGIEVVSVAIFSIEYLGRLWSAVEDRRFRAPVGGRLRWAVTPLALVDLAAVLPFFLAFVGLDLRVLRALRLMRIFRIAKAARYVTAISLLASVFRSRRGELALTLAAVGLLLLLAASLMYFIEGAVQPDAFSSIPATLWWAVATLTTVGYGDVYPITAPGRVLGAAVAILGIGLFALPTAILGSGFVEALERRRGAPVCPHCGEPL